MSIATLIVIASSFWSTHGYAVNPDQVTWQWGTCPDAIQLPHTYMQGCAAYNGNNIELVRRVWDKLRKYEQCILIIHEVGHAVFGFEHKSGTIMDQYMDRRPIPGICRTLYKNGRIFTVNRKYEGR